MRTNPKIHAFDFSRLYSTLLYSITVYCCVSTVVLLLNSIHVNINSTAPANCYFVISILYVLEPIIALLIV